MARQAYNYAKSAVDATGLPVRVDDVIKVFEPALAIEPTLREYLASARLTQKYWTKRFGNYVLDQLWGRLNSDQE
ncbi:MAG: hypothetical protein LC808_28200 [Actinobacteria bacterium]|nr:hypothetical protein [Actinomycetota bacterium]